MKIRDGRTWILLLPILLLPFFASVASADGGWSEDLDLLATDGEKKLFSGLQEDSAREMFFQQFWQARDPFPQTSRNEFREAWGSRLAETGPRWQGLADDRSRVFLLRGEPSSAFSSQCPKSGSFEVWVYEPGFRVEHRVVLFFLAPADAPARLWRPGVLPDPRPARVLEACSNPERLSEEARWMGATGDDRYEALLAEALSPPRPREWVSTFRSIPTIAAEGASQLDGNLEVEYAGPEDGKVVVRVAVLVPLRSLSAARPAMSAMSSIPTTSAIPGSGTADSLEFSVAGQVLRGGEPFETFLYRLRGELAGPAVALAFERGLPPGEYQMRVRVEHLASQRVLVTERELAVPAAQTAVSATSTVSATSAASAARRPRLRLLQPHGRLLTGRVSIPVQVEQEPETPPEDRVERVSFFLDGKPLLTRNHPPFDLIVDLGPVPRPRKLRAEGINGKGQVVARDEMLINGGAGGFRVRLLEPQSGRPYRRNLRIFADVTPPRGTAVERVEIWFGEDRVATLYQPPYALPFVLPREGQAGYVRAVAYLPGEGSAEDVVFVNAPVEPEEMDVRMVELYATVQDRQGRPVTAGLDPSSFTVIEDGVRQQVREVEKAGDTPVRVVTLIDSSGSMAEEMAPTRQAALGFLRSLLRPRDQAAVIAFNHSPRVMVPLTGDLKELEGGIRKILAESDTALYDSLVYSLLYLAEVKGQRAVLLLTDGKDRMSRLTYVQALETARRMGIGIYVIGLGVLDGPAEGAVPRLTRLAEVTGGQSFFIKSATELPGIYAQIETELRARYKISYQSSNTGTDDAFRVVQVRMAKEEMEARTISGYYP